MSHQGRVVCQGRDPKDPEHRTLALGHHRAILKVYLQKIFNEVFEKVLKDVLKKELIPTEVLEEFFENFLDELLEENLAEEDFLPKSSLKF